MNDTVFDVHQACTEIELKACDFAADVDPTTWELTNGAQYSSILTELCELIRTADPTSPDLPPIVELVNKAINRGVRSGTDLGFRFLPSFAHSNEFPVLGNPPSEQVKLPLLSRLLAGLTAIVTGAIPIQPAPEVGPWWTTFRPHILSTRLARFTGEIAALSHATPLTSRIYQVRCEVGSDQLEMPLSIMNGGICLVVPSTTGLDHCSAHLTYYVLGERNRQNDSSLTAHHMRLPVELATSDMTSVSAASDEENKLIFWAGRDVVKSYAWENPWTGTVYKSAPEWSCLSSPGCAGPLYFSAASCLLIRAGKNFAWVWGPECLQTRTQGSAIIKPTGMIKWFDPNMSPRVWHPHPNLPTNMLACLEGDSEIVDLSGKTGMRYLGHGGKPTGFSTSDGDPNVFLTAASDGYAQLFNTRMNLPVLSLRAGTINGRCAGLLIHPDGVPIVFTGAFEDQVIRLWDVRMRKMVYELSTGNNGVSGMTWDTARSTLYAVTTNPSTVEQDKDRKAWNALHPTLADNPEGALGQTESISKIWPTNPAHPADYFCHQFNEGSHRIFQYAFKEWPDPSIPPV
ncbi:hypothetical protein B0H10DRAFT_2210258 [Mycena sp. CBHHK59/15]|nr:hypothetical protein B0H10DRAFT_2210258 [Mycena sp. CBHHK59/15]